MDIRAIEKRWKVSTPGEWVANDCAVTHKRGYFWWQLSETNVDAHNADFIAHAHQDIPALLEALKAAQARNEALEGALDKILIASAPREWLEDDKTVRGFSNHIERDIYQIAKEALLAPASGEQGVGGE